jgi:tetratricopeptide (TPR) repeat protein/DNA-binding winged helix-turn-helix (wHTH) protein
MCAQVQSGMSAAIATRDSLVSRPRTGVRMRQSLLKGFYLQDLLIEPASGRVSGPGVEAHLKPKAVEVLLYLAERPFELVERDDLLRAVWGQDAGSSEALTHAISELRSCCKDHASSPSVIQTVPRRGYRLLQQARLVEEPELASGTGVFQVPDDGSFIGKLMRRGVVQAGLAYMVFSWLLIQVADAVAPTLNLPAWFPSVITYGAIWGFPILLVLAWALEQSDGRWFLDRGKQSGRLLSGLERNYLAIFVAYGIATIGAGIYQWSVGFRVPATAPAASSQYEELIPVAENSIAVLKLLNIDRTEKTQVFSDGISEDILDRLARLPGLRVAARGDSWSLPNNATSDMVRRRLRVAYFLEGSVRLAGNELRVVAQLIDSKTGFHVFSRSFNTDLQDFMSVQQEITRLIVANVRPAFPEDLQGLITAGEADTDVDAYELFRRGKEELDKPTSRTNIDSALAYFDAALAIDPDYAVAHAGRCRGFVDLYELERDTSSVDAAEEACNAALSANAQLTDVYDALGDLFLVTGKTAEAEATFRRALEIDDRYVRAIKGLASVYRKEQRFDKAEELLNKAIELQPGNWNSINDLGGLLFNLGRFADAAHAYRRVVYLDPDNYVALGNLGSVQMMAGDFKGALESFEKSMRIESNEAFDSNLAILHYYLGEFEQAVAIQRKVVQGTPNSVSAWLTLGDALHFGGDKAASTEAFSRAAELAREQLAVTPTDGRMMYRLAWAESMLGNEDTALDLVERALRKEPNNPYAHYYYSLINLNLGNVDAAIDAIEQAVELGYPPVMLAAEPYLQDLRGREAFDRLLN